MAIETDFAELMTDTATWYASSSVDFYGKRSHSASGTTLTCRVEWGKNVVRGSDARDITADGVIYVYGTSTIAVNDRLLLADGTEVRVISVETLKDQVGGHHTVIAFGAGTGTSGD